MQRTRGITRAVGVAGRVENGGGCVTNDPRATRHALAALLVSSLVGSDDGFAAGLAAVPAADAVAAADLHRVSPAVYRHVRRLADVPLDWLDCLAFRRHEQLMRHLRAVQDLKHTGAALDAAGVSWVAIKGPALAELVWPSPDMRQYTDLDLIVDRRSLETSLTVLQDAGLTLRDRNWPLLASTMRAEVAMGGRHGTPVDLHWDFAVPRELRRAFATDVDGLLSRSRRRAIGGSPVPVPDAVDTVLHLVFHTAQAGANLLVWLADIRFAAAVPDFDWQEFAARAQTARFEVPAAMVIARVDRVLGFVNPPTADVLRPARGAWGRLAALRDANSSFPGLPGDAHLGGTLYSAARRGLGATAFTAARSYVSLRRIEARVSAGQAEGRELLADVPDARDRRRYLDTAQFAAHP